jgi:hypothetical protein
MVNANLSEGVLSTVTIASIGGGTITFSPDAPNTEIDFSITGLDNKTWYYKVVEENIFRASTN